MVIAEKIPGLDACAACVVAKAVYFPHKEGRGRLEDYLGRVHIDIAGPMQVQSAGGKLYEYIDVDNYSRAVYTCPLRSKSDAPVAFKVFKAAAENESQKKLREVMIDHARELCMGEVKEICEKEEGIRLHRLVQYSPESNRVAQRTSGCLPARRVLRCMTPAFQSFCGQNCSVQRRTYTIRCQRGR